MVRLGAGSPVEIVRRTQCILLNCRDLGDSCKANYDDAKTRSEKNFQKNTLNHRFVVACLDPDWYSD